MNVILVAEEAAGIKMLRALGPLEHKVVAVMARESNEARSGPTVWSVAQALGYTTWHAERVTDRAFADDLRSRDVDIVLNVHSLFVIHPSVLAAPRLGCYNLHPGPLPRYAGLNAVSWAIYCGERFHGVTVHRMTSKIDAGPIAYGQSFPIHTSDSALMVSATCVRIGVQLMLRLLGEASNDPASVPAMAQDLNRRRYFGRNTPHDGRLTWSQSAAGVVNFIRACDYFPLRSPWGHPRARFAGREIGIVKGVQTGQPADEFPGVIGGVEGPAVRVACADEWIAISKVQVDGRVANAADVLGAGARLEDG